MSRINTMDEYRMDGLINLRIVRTTIWMNKNKQMRNCGMMTEDMRSLCDNGITFG